MSGNDVCGGEVFVRYTVNELYNVQSVIIYVVQDSQANFSNSIFQIMFSCTNFSDFLSCFCSFYSVIVIVICVG